jgi:hypothetical protein
VITLLVGCGKPPTGESPEAVADVGAKVRAGCVREARSNGYRAGNCAQTFIDRCISTQSRSEMASVLQVDIQLGIRNSSSCPNMLDTYSAEFDKF